MNQLAQQFRALSEDLRLKILALLFRHGELCVCEVERFLQISQSKASRHLRYLLNAGLVQDRRDSLWVYYRVAEPTTDRERLLFDALQQLLQDVSVPDISKALDAMRVERCHPASAAASVDKAQSLEISQ